MSHLKNSSQSKRPQEAYENALVLVVFVSCCCQRMHYTDIYIYIYGSAASCMLTEHWIRSLTIKHLINWNRNKIYAYRNRLSHWFTLEWKLKTIKWWNGRRSWFACTVTVCCRERFELNVCVCVLFLSFFQQTDANQNYYRLWPKHARFNEGIFSEHSSNESVLIYLWSFSSLFVFGFHWP